MSIQRRFSSIAKTLFASPYDPEKLGNPRQFGYDYDDEAPNKGIENIVNDPILYRRTIKLLDWRGTCAEQGLTAEDVRYIESLVDWPHGRPLLPVSPDNIYGVPPFFYDGPQTNQQDIENYAVMLLDDYLINLRRGPEGPIEKTWLETALFTKLGVTVEDFKANFESDEQARTEAIHQYLSDMEERHAFYDLDHNYIGMDFLKEVLLDLRATFNAAAADDKPSMHMAFKAGPGEGKSESAELVAKALHSFGMLSRGHTVKISLSEIASATHGGIEEALQQAFEKAKGGVLLFDESDTATSHTHKGQSRSPVSQIINHMAEKMRDDLSVIVATYPENMDEFLDSDPGLRSRFADRVIQFPEKSTETYVRMLENKLGQAGFIINDNNVRSIIWQHFSDTRKNLGKTFINGRVVREFAQSIRATITRQDGYGAGRLTYVTASDVTQTIEKAQKRAEPETVDVYKEINPFQLQLTDQRSGNEAEESPATVVSLDAFRKPPHRKP